jgi:hypothetical protein
VTEDIHVAARWLRNRRQARNARAEYLIVGALWHQAPQSAWTLMHKTGLTGPRLYGALRRLEHGGRVKSHWLPAPPTHARYYELGTQPPAAVTLRAGH